MHSILMLLSILSLIFFLTYFMKLKEKRVLKKIAEKQEPRFDLVETIVPEPEYYQPSDEEAGGVNLLLDAPLLQPTKKTVDSRVVKKNKSSVEEILYLILAARPDKPYVGYELLQALLDAGLRFGAMNIFHRYEHAHEEGKILFSVASASEAGTFDINKIGAHYDKGLILFMRLSSNKDLKYTFEILLETARQLTEYLGGDILDDEHVVLSTDKIDSLKMRIVEFEQKQLMGDLFDQ